MAMRRTPRELLASASRPTRLLVTDGVFSMDGDLAPLPELARAARAARAWLIVDDAHGLGVVGRTGRGTCEHFGLYRATTCRCWSAPSARPSAPSAPSSRASADLIEFLIQKARTYIYTTALPPAVAAATRAALRVSEREILAAREGAGAVAAPARGLRAARHPRRLAAPATTIVPVILGEAERALAASQSTRRGAAFW